jgi:uncharacterized membrane protein
MARGKSSGGGEGLLDSLRNSPETKRLTEEARHLFQAGSGRLTDKLGGGVTNVAKKLSDVGESGSLGFGGEGAKRMLSGDGPVKSAVGAATSGIADKAKGMFGKGKGGGKSKAMNIEETIDIGVPVSVAYDQWTQFQDFSRFMKGVESVEQTDDTELTWRTKVFKSTRTYKATIQEQVPDRRIVWTSEGAKGSTKGVVTFHPLADDLTRVLVALEYYPNGFVEKTGNLWRAAGRRARLDLKNFRRFVMMENEATGSWRGEIRDGDVVKGPDDEADDDDQYRDEDEQADEDDEDDEDSNEDEDSDADDEEGEDEDEDEDEGSPRSEQEDEQPRRRRPTAKPEPQKRSRRSRPAAKKSAGSNERPRKQAQKSSPAKKQAGKRPAAKKSSSARKQSGRSSSSPRKQASKRTTAKKQPSKRAPAKKQATKRAPAKKQASSSRRSPRKPASKRTTARKRSSG